MELIRGLHNITSRHQGCVLTIGNFDGVHFGHQSVLTRLAKQAKVLGLPSAVMIFEPQPREFFAPDTAPARLSRLRDKFVHLKELGIERLICVSFNDQLAALSAELFIEELLVKKLAVKHLVVGDDFRFGLKRSGNFDTLLAAGQQYGFEVVNMQTYRPADINNKSALGTVDAQRVSTQRVSSTLVRKTLERSDFKLAASLLGREYSISGRVVYGRQLGRTLGVPTANILLKRQNSPLQGVFLVEVLGASEKKLHGVANIGKRPSIDNSSGEVQLEVHIFDFSGQLYHKHLEVIMKQKLREEMKFASLEELKQQIKLDIASAKAILAKA